MSVPLGHAALAGARVLVTGGTGSIGSAVTRALLATPVEAIRILGRSESRLIELRDRLAADPRIEWWIGDVRDAERMRAASSGIDTIIHAAAMKHVAVCEENPGEAIGTNVLGTERVLSAGLGGGLRRFLLISSDKAVEPSGTLGETKERAEGVLAGAHRAGARAALVALRLGNVLGSRGSVLPRVLDRLRRGAPVEIVRGAVTRFFLTPEEAAERVLETLAVGEGGETLAPHLPAATVGDVVETFIEWVAPRLDVDPAAVIRRGRELLPGEKAHERLVGRREASRLRDDGRYFRVAFLGRDGGAVDLPAACRSESAPRLAGREIRALLERSGTAEVFGVPADGGGRP